MQDTLREFVDTTINKKAQALIERAAELLPDDPDLAHVGYDEDLYENKDLLRMLLTGDCEALELSIAENYDECRWDCAKDEAHKALEQACLEIGEEITALSAEFTWEVVDVLVDVLFERDGSDPLAQLLRNTRDVWARLPYKDPTGEIDMRQVLVQVPAITLWEFWTAVKYRGEAALLMVEGSAMVGSLEVQYPNSVNFEDEEVHLVFQAHEVRRAELDGVCGERFASTWADYVGGLRPQTGVNVYALTEADESAAVLGLASALGEIRQPGVTFSEMLEAARALAS